MKITGECGVESEAQGFQRQIQGPSRTALKVKLQQGCCFIIPSEEGPERPWLKPGNEGFRVRAADGFSVIRKKEKMSGY